MKCQFSRSSDLNSKVATDFWSSLKDTRKLFAAAVISVSAEAETWRVVKTANKVACKSGNRIGLSRKESLGTINGLILQD
jgi:hypothetical protein